MAVSGLHLVAIHRYRNNIEILALHLSGMFYLSFKSSSSSIFLLIHQGSIFCLVLIYLLSPLFYELNYVLTMLRKCSRKEFHEENLTSILLEINQLVETQTLLYLDLALLHFFILESCRYKSQQEEGFWFF